MSFGRTDSTTMTRAYGQRVLFCGRREEKVIPTSAVKEEVTARVLKQESLDGQPLSSSAKRSIKHDVLAEMLPRALCKSKRIQVYHDPEQSALILNSGIESEVEDLLNLLRTSIGTLNVYRWDASASIGLFTQWLAHKTLPDQLRLGSECTLFDPESVARVTWRGQSLDATELMATSTTANDVNASNSYGTTISNLRWINISLCATCALWMSTTRRMNRWMATITALTQS